MLGTEAERLSILPEVLHPESIHIDAEKIYIVDGHRILIYSLEDLSLITKFGKIGEEPDAFRANPSGNVTLVIDVQSERIVVNSHEWISFFSKDGEFLSSASPYPQVDFVIPMGENYIVSFFYVHVGTGKSAEHILIFDHKLEYVKKITEGFVGSGKAGGFGGPDRKLHIDLIPDSYEFSVFEDKIYVGDSSRGFYFEVYDSEGEKLYDIHREFKQVKVTDSYTRERMTEIQKLHYYNRHKDVVAVDEREYFPAFRNFSVTDGKLFVYTYREIDGQQEVHVLDIEGHLEAKVNVPKAKVSVIRDNSYYYLKKNENDEWELHRTRLDGALNGYGNEMENK